MQAPAFNAQASQINSIDEDFLSDQERQFSRVNVALFGRFMLENRAEFPCQITDMSPGSVALVTPVSGTVGEHVVAYIDHVGRVQGQILRAFDNGFAMSINASVKKRDELAARLTWLANRHELNLAEDRRHERVTPRNQTGITKMEDGRVYTVKILDLSLSGAAMEMEVRPAIGTVMWLGNMRGRVVRHFQGGVAIEFAAIQSRDALKDYLDLE